MRTRSPATTATIRERTDDLKQALRAFLADHGVEVVVAQNMLCLPMQLPLGLALTEVLVEQGLPALAHHHDFWWERERSRRTRLPTCSGPRSRRSCPAWSTW